MNECPICQTDDGHLPECPADHEPPYPYDAPEPEYVPLVEILGISKSGGVWL